MKVEKVINELWTEYLTIKEMEELKHIKCPIDKPQLIYSSDKGKISLVHFLGYFNQSPFWEIYCLEGNLFDGVERFKTKSQAIKRIKQLL